MVVSATSFSGNGLRDWLLQRFSAVILAAYTLFLLTYFLLHSPMDYPTWKALFSCALMQAATTVALLAIVVHAWIGVWTVIGDYVKPWCIRLCCQGAVYIGLLFLLVWGLAIIWSH